jgi:hypothetical protein
VATVYASTTVVVAEIAGGLPIMDRTANRILALAKAKARGHRLTGAYLAGLHVETVGRGKDRLVVAEDPGAIPIEFGYMRIVRRGRRVTAVHYPGLRIMRDTYGSVTGE